jgi:hypothetical protein
MGNSKKIEVSCENFDDYKNVKFKYMKRDFRYGSAIQDILNQMKTDVCEEKYREKYEDKRETFNNIQKEIQELKKNNNIEESLRKEIILKTVQHRTLAHYVDCGFRNSDLKARMQVLPNAFPTKKEEINENSICLLLNNLRTMRVDQVKRAYKNR